MTKQSNKRKFLATTLTATMVAAAVAPVAGAAAADTQVFPDVPADHPYAGVIADMVEVGIVKGETNGNFNLGGHITRAEAAQMVAGLLSLKTGVEANRTDFTDVKGDVWYTGAINSLVNAGVIAGVSEKTFAPNENITRGQIAQMLVVAYGLEDVNVEDVVLPFTDVADDAWYAKPIKILYKEGLINGRTATTFEPKSDMTRGDFTWLAANVDYVHGDKLPKPEDAVEAAVVSVSAINASEVVVTFNQEVDATTAKDSSNYEIKVNNKTVDVADVVANSGKKDAITVAADKKSVIIRLATGNEFQAGDKYVIQTNDAIKSAKGEALAKFVSVEKTFAESAEPKLLSVTPGLNTLTVEFDRPVVGSTPLVKVDGYDVDGINTNPTPLSATSNAAGNYKYTVAVTDQTAQDTIFEKGNHEVIIYDVKDTAKAYEATASVVTGLYTITDEVTVPEVKEVVAVNANRFFLRTNVAVDLATAKVKVEKGNHEFALHGGANAEFINDAISGTETVVDAVAGTYLSTSDHGVWVIVSDDVDGNDENPLYKGTETTANLKVTLENYKDAQTTSLLGKKSVTNVTLNKNNTKPAIEETKVNGNVLEVTFGNDLDATPALTASDVIVRDKDGVIISNTNYSIASGTPADTVGIDLGGNYKVSAEPYSVEFKADKFKYEEVDDVISTYLVNTLKNDKLTAIVKSTSTNFKYTELKLETTSGATQNVVISSTENGQDTIEITYDVEMDDSARNIANYQIDGKALPAGSTVDFVDGKDKVRIVLPAGSLVASTSYKLTISTNVTTKEGSIIVGSLQTKAPSEAIINLDDNVAPELTGATYLRGDEEVKPATSTDTIELTFSENVKLGDLTPGNAIGSTHADLIDDLAVVVSGTRIDVKEIDVDPTNKKRMIITLGQSVNVSQAATITVVPEAEQKDSKTTYIVDIAGNKAKSESTTTANTSKFSAAVAGSQQAQADLQTVATAKTNLTIAGDLTNVTANLTLPTSQNGATVAWASSDPAVVSTTGVVTRPVSPAGDATVTLTATITKGAATDTKVFTVTVKEQ